jgi:ribosome-associated protein
MEALAVGMGEVCYNPENQRGGIHLQPKKIAELLKSLAEDKKAEDLILLDIAKISSLAHYFLICHGNSDRHVKSIAMHLMDEMKKRKMPAWHVEGLAEGKWALLDFGPVIAHIFYKETREFYSLERLWGEAKEI